MTRAYKRQFVLMNLIHYVSGVGRTKRDSGLYWLLGCITAETPYGGRNSDENEKTGLMIVLVPLLLWLDKVSVAFMASLLSFMFNLYFYFMFILICLWISSLPSTVSKLILKYLFFLSLSLCAEFLTSQFVAFFERIFDAYVILH